MRLTASCSVWFYAFMRTTVELPPELMRQAKAHAASKGESLKALLTRAVSAELGRSLHSRGSAVRVRLPLFGSSKRRPAKVSAADIARALVQDDVAMTRRASGSPKK
jgi:hypothetical protein